MKKALPILCIALLSAVPARAQIMAQSTRFAAPGESEQKKDQAEPQAQTGANLLSQASVNAGSTSPEVGLQVGDLYMTSRWRLYIRTTLPIKATDKSSAASKPSDHVISALFDEYGGLLNSTVGYYRCLVPWRGEKDKDAHDVSCSDPKQPDHGLFLDSRLGLKFIDLPTVPESVAPTIADVSVTPFYTGVITLRFVAPLYSDPDLATEHLAGGLTMNVSYVLNRVADRTLSDLFKVPGSGLDAPLRTFNHNLTISVGINLGGVTYLSLSGTPWASDGRLAKRFAVSVNVARPTKDTQAVQTPEGATKRKTPSML